MTRGRRWRGVVSGPLVVIVLALAGCSGVPSSGEVNDIRTVGDVATPAQPQAPQPGQLPDQIVRGFIQASADANSDPKAAPYAAAQQFLTPAARKTWQTTATPVIVLDDFFQLETDRSSAAVTIRGTQVAMLDADRSYRALPLQTAYRRTLHMEQVDGEWRVSDPPREVLVREQDFGSAFLQRTVFFLDASGTVVVPDPRYLEAGLSAANRISRLVNLLLAGPSTRLKGGATSAFGASAELRSNVTTDDQGVWHVDLRGIDPVTQDIRDGLAAQLVWTLYPDASKVAISLDGASLGGTAPANGVSVYTLQSVDSYNPDRVAGSGQVTLQPWFIDPEGAIIGLTAGRPPMWGKVGTGSSQVTQAAISSANGTLAAVVAVRTGDSPSDQLLLGRPLDHENAMAVLAATSITPPTFTRTGDEVWVVQNGATAPQVIEVTTTGTPARGSVEADGLAGKGAVTQLVLSPDGVRVAVVAGGKLYVGVVVEIPPDPSGSGKPGAAIRDLTEIAPDLTAVGPIAFDAANQLVVAAGSRSALTVLYQVSIDGRQVVAASTDGLYGDVTAVSVSPGQPPLMSWGGRVYELDGQWSSGRWIAPLNEQALLGSAPFYPS